MEQLQEYIRHLESRAKAAEAALADLLEERPDFDDAIRHRQEHRRCENCRYFEPDATAPMKSDGRCIAATNRSGIGLLLALPWCDQHNFYDDNYDDVEAELLVKKGFCCAHFADKHQEQSGIVLGVDAEG